MTTNSPWPPSGPPPGQQPGPYGPYLGGQGGSQPSGYAQPQYVQPQYAQPQPYGPVGHPAPYVASPPTPRAERPLMPGVWWSLVINLVVTALIGLGVLLIGWALIEVVTGATGEDDFWRDAYGSLDVAPIVLIVAIALLASLLVSWLLTVAALALWRLLRGFRTIPSFLQALIAYVTMWVVTSVLSFVGQIVFGIFGAASSGSTGTY